MFVVVAVAAADAAAIIDSGGAAVIVTVVAYFSLPFFKKLFAGKGENHSNSNFLKVTSIFRGGNFLVIIRSIWNTHFLVNRRVCEAQLFVLDSIW